MTRFKGSSREHTESDLRCFLLWCAERDLDPRYLEPFHASTITTGSAAIPDTSHAWQAQHQCWNNGLMDSWVTTHIAVDGPGVGPYTMAYYTQEDLPFHWALAEAFTLLDGYHCSVMGPSALTT